jgi:hypothetical protein
MGTGRLEAFSGGVLWANLHLLFWLSLSTEQTSWLLPSRTSSSNS